MAPWETPKAPWETDNSVVTEVKDYASRSLEALPSALSAAAKGIVKLPMTGIGTLAGFGDFDPGEKLTFDERLQRALEYGSRVGEASTGWLPKFSKEHEAEEVIGKGFEKAGEVAGTLANEFLNLSPDQWKYLESQAKDPKEKARIAALAAQAEAAYRLPAEIAANAAPIPGAKAVSRVVHAPIERRISNKLQEAIDNQRYVNPDTIDPTTAGAIPGSAPWEKTQGQRELPLGGDPLGVNREQTSHYESGLPPDAYLKGRLEETGQGDLFANTRPYESREAMLAADLERSRREGTTVREATDDLADRYPQGYDPASTLALRDDMTTRDSGMAHNTDTWRDDITRRSEPGADIEYGKPLPDYGTPVGESRGPRGDLPPISAAEGKPRIKGPAATANELGPEAFKAHLENQFPGSDNGIVKLGNGGFIDLRGLGINGDMFKDGVRKILEISKGINKGFRLHSTGHGDFISVEVVDRDGNHAGGTTLSKKFLGASDQTNALSASMTKTDASYTGRHLMADVYSRLANEGNHIYPAKAQTEAGQGMWESFRKNGLVDEQGHIKLNDNPYEGPINLANGGFLSKEFTDKVFDFVKSTVAGKAHNTVEGTKEAARLFNLDRRSPEEVIKSIDPKTIQDISGTTKAISNFTDSSGIVETTKNYSGSNVIIKWTHDMLKLTDKTTDIVKENLLKGTEFVKGLRGFEFRTTSDSSPVKLLQNAIKDDWRGSTEMLKQWFEAAREGREPTFENAKHKEIYDAWQKVFDYTREHMNIERARAGLPPIPKALGYFPLMRMGDYRVIITDGNNNIIGSFHAPTKFGAEALRKNLINDPDLKGAQVGEVTHLNKSKYDYRASDFTALEAANKALADQPDVLRAVERAYAEVMKHRGFGGKHALESQHLLGAMGLEPTKKGAIDALKAFEMYTERSMDYIGNLQKRARFAEMIKQMAEGNVDVPNTKQLITDMFNHSTTNLKNLAEVADVIVNTIGRATGLGEQGVRAKLRQSTALVNAWLLSTGAFIMSQVVQAGSGVAGLVVSEGGGLRGAALAGRDLIQGLHYTLFPTPEHQAGINWASKNGYIQPAFAELYGARHIQGGLFTVQKLLNGFSWTGQKLETHFVRVPYFLMQMEALKGKYKGEALYEAAGERTDHYMVNYDKSNQAMVWQRLGAVGEAAKPLKQFSNNFLGQFIEYAREAKHGDVVPMVTMFATTTLLAGLAGNIAVQTADDVIRGLNAIGDVIGQKFNIPTVQELVMKHVDSDLLTFGIGSKITGYDISSSVAQNSVKSLFSVPLATVGTKTATELGNYGWKKLHGTATEADAARALLAITPPGLRESVKQSFVKDGIVPDLHHNMEKVYQRTPEEDSLSSRMVSGAFGRPPLKEARKENILRYAREDLRELVQDRRSASAVLADKILAGEQVTQEDFMNYVKEGGDPNNIMGTVKARLMAKQFDLIERAYMKKGISGQAEREKLKEEKTASESFIQPQAFSDDKTDAKGNLWAALPFHQLTHILGNMPPVPEKEAPPVLGRKTMPEFHESRSQRLRAHKKLMGAI